MMYSYSGSVQEDDVYFGHKELSMPYWINCCGYIKLDDIDVALNRTRMDFYLIYLINGAGHYITDNGTITAKAGSIILYRPEEHQNYYYKAVEKTELYWIHFTGYEAESLLNELDFRSGNFYPAGIHAEFIELFENIIHELQMKKPRFQQLCISYLLQLLSAFSREAGGERAAGKNDLENAVKAMNEEFQQEHSIDYYARKSHLSLFQFIRNFKKLTGYTPVRYIEKIRIAKAKELLRDSSLSIAEISGIVGYSDPFYFSKVFKKASGETPTQFRDISPDPSAPCDVFKSKPS